MSRLRLTYTRTWQDRPNDYLAWSADAVPDGDATLGRVGRVMGDRDPWSRGLRWRWFGSGQIKANGWTFRQSGVAPIDAPDGKYAACRELEAEWLAAIEAAQQR